MDITRNPIRETILQLYASGLSKREIRKEIGCSAHTISKYLAGPVNELGSKIVELRSKGLSVNDIRSALGCSKSTVSKWCSTITENDMIKDQIKQEKSIKSELRHVHSQKQKQITMELGRGTNCNYRNWRKSIREKRKNFLIEIAGGGCAICGYNITKSALDFHHVDPITKKFGICGTSLETSISKLLKEVSKCILLCKNHHAELHDGILDISGIPTINVNVQIPHDIRDFDKLAVTDEIKAAEKLWIQGKLSKNQTKLQRRTGNYAIDQIQIRETTRNKINKILDNYHYLGASNKGDIFRFEFVVGDECLGVALITNPVRSSSLTDVCELSRFVLTVDQPNIASKCLSLLIRELKWRGEYKILQSFCDDDTHLGTIYKAANFRQFGGSHKTYNYNGIHKKTIYERAKSMGLNEHEYAIMFGLEKIIESSKTKFIYDLT